MDGRREEAKGGTGITHYLSLITHCPLLLITSPFLSLTKSRTAALPSSQEGGSAASRPAPMYAKPPVPTFYDGILMLESAKGV